MTDKPTNQDGFLKRVLNETTKDFYSKLVVRNKEKDAAVQKLLLAGEFEKAQAVQAHDFGRTGVTSRSRQSILNRSNLSTTTVRGLTSLAFLPIALPAIFARNAFNDLMTPKVKVETGIDINTETQPDVVTPPALATGQTPTETAPKPSPAIPAGLG